MGLLDGKVVIVTGAGRGIGRGEAILFAREGARVIVNDVGGSTRGEGSDTTPAEEVVKEIETMGGEALANYADVTDFKATKELIDGAAEKWGDVNVIVNNAGILRDRMVFNMEESEWDAVVAVHMKGTFNSTRHAAAYWRERSKAQGGPVYGRIINTSSPSGLFGNAGQANYGAAKAGIAAFTVIVAQELQRYGVTVNAIAPSARTRMTEETFGLIPRPQDGFDRMDPDNIAPIVVYLATEDAAGITGQVFGVTGGNIALLDGWRPVATIDKSGRWEPEELTKSIEELIPGKQKQPEPMAARMAAGQPPIRS